MDYIRKYYSQAESRYKHSLKGRASGRLTPFCESPTDVRAAKDEKWHRTIMKQTTTILLWGIVEFLLITGIISGLSYVIEGEVNWMIALGTAIGFSGFSIISSLVRRR